MINDIGKETSVPLLEAGEGRSVPVAVAVHPDIERLIRESEDRHKPPAPPKPVLSAAVQRAPFGYD